MAEAVPDRGGSLVGDVSLEIPGELSAGSGNDVVEVFVAGWLITVPKCDSNASTCQLVYFGRHGPARTIQSYRHRAPHVCPLMSLLCNLIYALALCAKLSTG